MSRDTYVLRPGHVSAGWHVYIYTFQFLLRTAEEGKKAFTLGQSSSVPVISFTIINFVRLQGVELTLGPIMKEHRIRAIEVEKWWNQPLVGFTQRRIFVGKIS